MFHLNSETDGSAHAWVCLGRYCSLKGWLYSAQHLARNVWPWHCFHIHSILKDQPGCTRKALSSSTCNESIPVPVPLLMIGWWLRGKAPPGKACRNLWTHVKKNIYCSWDIMTVQRNTADSQWPTNPERDKKQSLTLKPPSLYVTFIKLLGYVFVNLVINYPGRHVSKWLNKCNFRRNVSTQREMIVSLLRCSAKCLSHIVPVP